MITPAEQSLLWAKVRHLLERDLSAAYAHQEEASINSLEATAQKSDAPFPEEFDEAQTYEQKAWINLTYRSIQLSAAHSALKEFDDSQRRMIQ